MIRVLALAAFFALAPCLAPAQQPPFPTYKNNIGRTLPAPFPFLALCPEQDGVTPTTARGLILPRGTAVNNTCATTTVAPSYAVVCAYGSTVYYTLDGVATPTTSTGQIAAGACIALYGPDEISKFQMFSSAGTVSYWFWQ